jgi:integrase
VGAGLLPASSASGRHAATMTELLEEFGRHLTDGGATPRHARDRTMRAGRVIAAAGAVRPADLTPGAVIRAVARIAEELGLSRRTRHHHVSSVKQFTRWLATTRKSEPSDHLSGLVCSADDSDPTFRRRALSADDFGTLLSKTRGSKAIRRGLTGRERAALYLTAARTGLRASELFALTAAEFDLGNRPVVIVRARTAKNRKDAELPLRSDVVAEVKPIVAKLKRGERVWPNRGPGPWYSWHVRAADMIAADMVAAGLLPETAEGVYDLHALRGQFATDLERAGVSLPKAQRLMRHSTPALTSKHYIRSTADDLADEVAKIGKRPRKGG